MIFSEHIVLKSMSGFSFFHSLVVFVFFLTADDIGRRNAPAKTKSALKNE